MRPKHIKFLQAKGKKLQTRVFPPDAAGEPYVVIVSSGSTRALNRVVTVYFEASGTINARCTCNWAQHGGIACCHVLAALNRLAAMKKRSLSFWLTRDEAHRQKQPLFLLIGDRMEENIWITSRRPADGQRTRHANHVAPPEPVAIPA